MFHATETHHCQRDTRPSIRHSNRSGTSWRTPFLRLELLSLVSARPVNRLLVVVARQKTLASKRSKDIVVVLSSLCGDTVANSRVCRPFTRKIVEI